MDAGLDALTVDTLRDLFRGLQQWRSTVEGTVSMGTGAAMDMECILYEGNEWCLFDIERLYRISQTHLTPRQAQAINYFLVQGMREQDVAIQMGIKPSNPIGMYATDGLACLIEMIQNRVLPD